MRLTNKEKQLLNLTSDELKTIENKARFVIITGNYDKRISHKEFKKMNKEKFLYCLTRCIFHGGATAFIDGVYYYFDLKK